MIKLVYILGSGSKWEDNELRYSLRSVALHGRNVAEVIICGTRPAWVQNITHLPAKDNCQIAADNVWNKVRTVCDALQEPFVLMNDDFYLLHEVDFERLPLYYDGTIDQLLERYKRTSNYRQVQANTLKLLEAHHRTTRNYALHVPITIDPVIARGIFKDYGTAPALSFRNIYGNSCPAPHGRMPLQDLKLSEPQEAADIKTMEAFKTFFSIGDRFLTAYGKQYLQQLYPQKSIYEQ